jgi:hypothetical protein
MSRASRFVDLISEYGKAAVDEVLSVLGRDAEPAMVAKAVAQRAKAAPKKLDMSFAARTERARAMGYDVDNPLYVSRLENADAFAPHGSFMGHKGVSGISLTDNPNMASRYLDRYGDFDYKGEPFTKNMMKVFIRPGEVRRFDAPMTSRYPTGAPLPADYAWPEDIRDADTLVFSDALSAKGAVRHVSPGAKRSIAGLEYILRDPSRVRSVAAAFDPEFLNDPNLMKKRGGLAVKRKK